MKSICSDKWWIILETLFLFNWFSIPNTNWETDWNWFLNLIINSNIEWICLRKSLWCAFKKHDSNRLCTYPLWISRICKILSHILEFIPRHIQYLIIEKAHQIIDDILAFPPKQKQFIPRNVILRRLSVSKNLSKTTLSLHVPN